MSLAFSYIPMKALCQRVEPVGNLVLGADARHRVDGGGNPKAGKTRTLNLNFLCRVRPPPLVKEMEASKDEMILKLCMFKSKRFESDSVNN